MSEGDGRVRPRHGSVRPGVDGRFFDDATHQVWAHDRDTREWLYLPDGAARLPVSSDPGAPTWYERCHAGELLCPFPTCGEPFSHTRGGQQRHAFVHHRGLRSTPVRARKRPGGS